MTNMVQLLLIKAPDSIPQAAPAVVGLLAPDLKGLLGQALVGLGAFKAT